MLVIGELGLADGPDARPARPSRPRARGHPPPPRERDRHLSRGPRAAHLRDRRRHPGYGPLERLLADDSITEVMVNGPSEIWIERQGASTRRPCASRTTRTCDASSTAWSPRSAGASTSRRRWSTRLPDGSRVNAIIHPALALGPASHDPEVREEAPRAAGHDQPRLVEARSRSTSSSAASRRSSTSSSPAVPARGRRRS